MLDTHPQYILSPWTRLLQTVLRRGSGREFLDYHRFLTIHEIQAQGSISILRLYEQFTVPPLTTAAFVERLHILDSSHPPYWRLAGWYCLPLSFTRDIVSFPFRQFSRLNSSDQAQSRPGRLIVEKPEDAPALGHISADSGLAIGSTIWVRSSVSRMLLSLQHSLS